MRHIYIEYFKIVLVNNAVYILPIVFLATIIYSVSLPNVFHNIPKSSLGEGSVFMFRAVANTEIFIKVVLGLFAASAFLPLQRLVKVAKGFKITNLKVISP